MPEPLFRAENLSVSYGGGRSMLRSQPSFAAVTDVSIDVMPGEILGIVGESGAGKSTVARCIVGLQQPDAGTLSLGGHPFDPRRDRAQRRAVQMVFQEPEASLNPRMAVGATLTELVRIHGLAKSREEQVSLAIEALEIVGLPASALTLRPRSFSGGQRQRISIARALIVRPQLVVADEAVSALDVSVQAAILVLLKRLQSELGLAVVLISHDLAVVHQLCDRVVIMHGGRVIESGEVDEVFDNPRDPYTRELLGAATQLPPLELPASMLS